MSDLNFTEKQKLEKIFEMSSGFVLDFSNWKFREFVLDSVGVGIYDDKYVINGDSKARRLRAFWQLESNHLVGKIIKDLLSYASEIKSDINQTLFTNCIEIANRLLQSASLEVDLGSEKEFHVLAESIKESVNKNAPEAGLDRLHTYATKFIRSVCSKRGIDAGSPPKSLDSLFGEYKNLLMQSGEVKSKTTGEILKSAGSVFKFFNNTRNNESFAHDNQILNKDESLLILKHVTATLAFIRIIESRRVENFKIEKDFPDKLRSKILVSDVVKKKVQLRQRNQEFLGLCPFHNEKSPSFVVNVQKGFYHCFGCAAHGDVIQFLMKSEELEYKSAIIKLMEDFNICL